jgi:DNA-binding protein HU-beta
MVKADLMQGIADNCGLTKKHAEQVLVIFQDAIIEAVRNGGKLEIRGFGVFSRRSKSSAYGLPFKTKLRCTRYSVHFKPFTALKDIVNA